MPRILPRASFWNNRRITAERMWTLQWLFYFQKVHICFSHWNLVTSLKNKQTNKTPARGHTGKTRALEGGRSGSKSPVQLPPWFQDTSSTLPSHICKMGIVRTRSGATVGVSVQRLAQVSYEESSQWRPGDGLQNPGSTTALWPWAGFLTSSYLISQSCED